jgi:predicted RNase H-like nuclease (RuvC/YqgF family)
MNKENKKYVSLYLPESIADKLNAMEEDGVNAIMDEYMEHTKRDLKSTMDSMDDEIIQYKAFMIDARKKFKAAKEAELEANWALWDEFEDQKKSLHNKAQQAADQLKPLTEELTKISSLMNGIDKWGIGGFLEMLKEVKNHLHGEDRNILEFLVKNYKKGE